MFDATENCFIKILYAVSEVMDSDGHVKYSFLSYIYIFSFFTFISFKTSKYDLEPFYVLLKTDVSINEFVLISWNLYVL